MPIHRRQDLLQDIIRAAAGCSAIMATAITTTTEAYLSAPSRLDRRTCSRSMISSTTFQILGSVATKTRKTVTTAMPTRRRRRRERVERTRFSSAASSRSSGRPHWSRRACLAAAEAKASSYWYTCRRRSRRRSTTATHGCSTSWTNTTGSTSLAFDGTAMTHEICHGAL